MAPPIGDIEVLSPARSWWKFAVIGVAASLMWMGGAVMAALEIPLSHLPSIFGAMLIVVAVMLARRARRPVLAGLGFGLGCVPVLAWIHWFLWQTSAAGFVPMMLYLAAYPALAVWVCGRIGQRWGALPLVVYVPLVWAGFEVLRGEVVLSGDSWLSLSHGMVRENGVSWLAPFIGQYGLSFVMLALICGCVDFASRKKASGPRGFNLGVAGFMSLVFLVLLALAPYTSKAEKTLRVAVVQTNLPQSNKLAWELEQRVREHQNWLGLTAFAGRPDESGRRADVIVWPETMFAGEALNVEAVEVQRRSGLSYGAIKPGGPRVLATEFADTLVRQQSEMGVPMLVGAMTADGLRYDEVDGRVKQHADARYNSVVMVRGGVIEPGRYDKRDLMPFGEFIPIAWRWPAVQDAIMGVGAAGMKFDLAMGKGEGVWVLGDGVRVVTPICFEISYDRSCRRLVVGPDGERRAGLMINASNDGWFYESRVGRGLFLLSARWRAAELRTPVVRAANTGVSCVIDRHGAVLNRKLDDGKDAFMREGVMTTDAPVEDGPLSIYARMGTWILYGLGGGAVMMMAAAFAGGGARARGKPAAGEPSRARA